MNLEAKEKWLEALRSGKYTQGRNYLCQVIPGVVSKYCCLGVLCELHGSSRLETSEGTGGTNLLAYDYQISKPPYQVQEWAGLTDTQIAVLIEMNDAKNKSFTEIADHIEAEL